MSEGALVTRHKETTLDRIRKYYLKGEDSVSLTEKEEQTRIDTFKSWNLLINYHSKEQAVQVMMKAANNDEGCSRATAYRIVGYALSIFGDVFKNTKEAKRYLIEEDLKRLQQRAIKAGDGKLELNVIKQMIKIGGFDKDTDPKFDPKKLESNTYILKMHPSVLAVIEKMGSGGVFNFNDLPTEDIEHEEVNEKEEENEEE